MCEKTEEQIEHEKLVKRMVIAALRRLTYRFPTRSAAIKAAWRSRGKYECADCKELVGTKGYKVDHIQPTVDPEKGFIDWNTYIERLLPMISGWQVLCISCHDKKTMIENSIRKAIRDSKKMAKPKKTKKKVVALDKTE